jgi:hypothetical protein
MAAPALGEAARTPCHFGGSAELPLSVRSVAESSSSPSLASGCLLRLAPLAPVALPARLLHRSRVRPGAVRAKSRFDSGYSHVLLNTHVDVDATGS